MDHRENAYADAGDSPSLGPLLVAYHYREIAGEWEGKAGRKSHQSEITPMLLSAFMHSILDINFLAKEGRVEDARKHMTRALDHVNSLIKRTYDGEALSVDLG